MRKNGVGKELSSGCDARPPQQKRKKTSVLLAVFLGFWSWRYTWRKDWPQFVIGALLHCVVAPALFALGAFGDLGGSFAVRTALICVAMLVQLVVWFAAIIDAVATPSGWYANYPRPQSGQAQMRRSYWLIVLVVTTASPGLRGAEPALRGLADPVVEDIWMRPPAEEKAAKPVWGLAEGLKIGLAPLPGPRGLLRVYTPYVGQPDWRMINFIAIEPIVEGRTHRSFSELERSSLVEGAGKVMWSVDRPGDWTPRDPTHPARGVLGEKNGVEMLTVFFGIEKFRSGADVFLRLTFREDRPCEVQIATFTLPTSAPLSYCVVTATMGNYARLRRLHFATGVVTARELYSDATFSAIGFAPHKRFGLERLVRTRDGAVILAATSDESDPAGADQTTVARGWRYVGRPATQYWECDYPHPKLMAMVNARRTYWASNNSIPGGVSFENVELIAPFQPGQSWTFGVTTDPPMALIHDESTLDAAKD